ncbi:hypothetical protein K458DRAFT_432335 [Lentithecium fluviatile CBS 122367]|uniref:BTB domain-containing protein n=1 Tax=Lentithecium fluviatile CBS 122367 TaxID=1168545 RepID=A0A6G1IXD0_9PLEO|nr:hypothetical protein K458DRAFT_432335 [Lentithecium fluviatile CBS 122367]
MHRFGPAAPQLNRSQASAGSRSPPAKRFCPTLDGNSDSGHTSSNESTLVSAMIPSSLSQHSNTEQRELEMEAQTNSPSIHMQPDEDAGTTASCETETLSFHKLLDTAITLEYGEKLDQKCSIHLQLLSDHSPKLRQLFVQASELREAYLKAKSMRQKAKALTPPNTSAEAFLGKGVDEMVARAVNLITRAYENFPLLEYRDSVKKALEAVTDEQFQITKMWRETPSHGNIKRKDYPSAAVTQRLRLMKAEVVLIVLNQLLKALRSIKAQELNKAFKDSRKAAAQHRILLPDTDGDTLGSLVHWVYNRDLQFLDANHLCKIYGLASRLGFQELGEICLDNLSHAASKAINAAKTEGVLLQDLLDGTPTFPGGAGHVNSDPLSGVVRTVFTFVIQQERPPTVLKKLLIEAVADNADPSLVETFLQTMSGEMKTELGMALTYRLFKLKNVLAQLEPTRYPEESSNSSVKSEVPNISAELKRDDHITGHGMDRDNGSTHVNASPGSLFVE